MAVIPFVISLVEGCSSIPADGHLSRMQLGRFYLLVTAFETFRCSLVIHRYL